MLVKNMWCENCNKVHFVEIAQREWRENKLLIVKTKCHEGKTSLSHFRDENNYTRHEGFGYYAVVQKYKRKKGEGKKSLPKIMNIYPVIKEIPTPVRKCVAEYSMSIRGQFVTIKVFEDATPEKFYEFFYEVGGKAAMVKPRNLGKESPVHIADIPKLWKAESKASPIFHNHKKYEELLTIDPSSVSTILEKNRLVLSANG